MKALRFTIIMAMILLISCSTGKNENIKTTDFELYETISNNNLSTDIREKLSQSNIIIETDTLSAIVGYIQEGDSVDYSFQDNETKFLTTKYPVNKEKKLYALVAVKKNPALNNTDVKNTRPNQCNVEIYLNFSGAKKWADLTKKSIGKMIAISINEKIYTLATVNSEIRNGVAMITGLENEETAIEISNSITK